MKHTATPFYHLIFNPIFQVTPHVKAHTQVKNMQMRGAPGPLAANISEDTKFQVPNNKILPLPKNKNTLLIDTSKD